jgi:hypothetical protein
MHPTANTTVVMFLNGAARRVIGGVMLLRFETMNWLTKLKEKAQEHTILGVFALISLLSLVIWKAVPSEVWDKISAIVPKRVLWALLGLTLIAVCLEAAYIFGLRKERKNLKGSLESKLFLKFGALWDGLNNPYCPSCKNPLPQKLKGPFVFAVGSTSGKSSVKVSPAVPVLECVQCNKEITLIDDDGKQIALKDAKEQISSQRAT